jgi:hypothetical protein
MPTSPPPTWQVVRNVAAVAGVVVVVLTLLAVAVYVGVFHDVMPAMH